MKKYIQLSLIIFSVSISSCTKLEDPRKPVDLSKIVTIGYRGNDSVLIADGADNIEVLALLNEDNVTANIPVTFTTEQGSFVGAGSNPKSITVKADGYTAKVVLRSDDVVNDKVQLSVTVGDYIIYPQINFKRSFPEEIIVQPSKFGLTPDLNDKVLLTMNMKKAIGVVSKGTKVDFKILTLTGTPSLFIQPVYWNETPLNKAEVIATTADTGKVGIISRVFNNPDYINSEDTIYIHVQ
jgi:hypothetical protein